MIFGRVERVVTDLAIMDFHPQSKRMRLRELQTGVTVEEVHESTGFEVLVEDAIEHAPPRTSQELEVLRNLDPNRSMLG